MNALNATASSNRTIKNNNSTSKMWYAAAKYGGVEIFKKNNHTRSVTEFLYMCSYAAKGNKLENLKWLRRQGCAWSSEICTIAAANGFFELLKWATKEKNDMLWDYNTCKNAALNGHFEVIKWARLNAMDCDYKYFIKKLKKINKSSPSSPGFLLFGFNFFLRYRGIHQFLGEAVRAAKKSKTITTGRPSLPPHAHGVISTICFSSMAFVSCSSMDPVIFSFIITMHSRS